MRTGFRPVFALLVVLLAAPAMACWCDQPSLRQLMAYSAQVAEIEIVSVESEGTRATSEGLLAPGATPQHAIATIREVYLGVELHVGDPLPLQQTSAGDSDDGCGASLLAAGQRWIAPLRNGRIDAQLGGCPGAQLASTTSRQLAYHLGREFQARRQMSDADWQSLLVPLQARLQQISGEAKGCVARIGERIDQDALAFRRLTRPARECALALVADPSGGWMIAEDARSDRPAFYGAARSGDGPVQVLIAPLEASTGGQLSLDPARIQPDSCTDTAHHLGLEDADFCQSHSIP